MKPEVYFFDAAGFSIKLVFRVSQKPATSSYLKKEIIRIWKDYIYKKRKRYDFELIFSDEEEYLVRGKKYYGLVSKKEFSKRRFLLSYAISIKSFDLILREVFSWVLEKEGFLLHGSGVLGSKGELLIFVAPSGGGKTTVAKLAGRKESLKFCDDILVAKKEGSKWNFFSPPFIEKEEMPKKAKADNAKIFFVRKRKKAKVSRVTNKKDIMVKFISQIWTKDGVVSSKIIKNAGEFIQSNRFYILDSTLNKKEIGKVLNET